MELVDEHEAAMRWAVFLLELNLLFDIDIVSQNLTDRRRVCARRTL